MHMQITDMNIDEIIRDLCRSHTDLENHVAPNPQIDNQVLHIEANFWQKIAATWGFCLATARFSPCYSNGQFNRL